MMNEVGPKPVIPPGEVEVAGATGDEAVTLRQLRNAFSGGGPTPIALTENGEVNGWKFQVGSGGGVYGWCMDKLCYISWVVEGLEPSPLTSELGIEPMVSFEQTYYFCDVYPPGEPYQQDYDFSSVESAKAHVIGEYIESETGDGTYHCEWDSENQRFRLYYVTGEPGVAAVKKRWDARVLLMSQ